MSSVNSDSRGLMSQVNQCQLEKVSRYIDNQETHHRLGKLSDLLERTEGDEDQSDEDIAPLKGAEEKREEVIATSPQA